MTDNELLSLLRSDPKTGLAEVVRRYSAYVMKIAYTRLCDVCTKEDMEEAVSDIFLKFYRSGQQNDFEITSIRAFLSVLASRHCIDIFRRKMRETDTISLEDAEELSAEETDFPSSSVLTEHIGKLSETDRQLVIRKFYFGQKSRDIALELDLKPNTVDKRISRALAKLRKMIEEDMRNEEQI